MFNHITMTIMKKMMLTMAMLMTIAISASAMTYREARNYARVMTDRMAVELRLTDRQYREVYNINYRYVESPVMKDRALRQVLSVRQYDKYMMLYRSPMASRHRTVVVRGNKHVHHAPATAHRARVYTRW